MQVIECIPNFSEGRDKKKIEKIANAIKKVPEVKLLHQTSDVDHNRSVMTFIGPPEKVIEAAFRACQKAAELINLTDHQGVHPCIGATDVIPLVPLKNISFKKCTQFAEKLGEKIGTELNIPVYLYEKAARKPERENLANIRNKEHLTSPDFGPKKPGEAGSVAVGVREILIAYNINLDTNDLKTAENIAKSIRESNGGLPFVKALGLSLSSRNIVQVSMNLTNYKMINIPEVYEEVGKLAKTHGVKILGTEVIGLTPEEILENI